MLAAYVAVGSALNDTELCVNFAIRRLAFELSRAWHIYRHRNIHLDASILLPAATGITGPIGDLHEVLRRRRTRSMASFAQSLKRNSVYWIDSSTGVWKEFHIPTDFSQFVAAAGCRISDCVAEEYVVYTVFNQDSKITYTDFEQKMMDDGKLLQAWPEIYVVHHDGQDYLSMRYRQMQITSTANMSFDRFVRSRLIGAFPNASDTPPWVTNDQTTIKRESSFNLPKVRLFEDADHTPAELSKLQRVFPVKPAVVEHTHANGSGKHMPLARCQLLKSPSTSGKPNRKTPSDPVRGADLIRSMDLGTSDSGCSLGAHSSTSESASSMLTESSGPSVTPQRHRSKASPSDRLAIRTSNNHATTVHTPAATHEDIEVCILGGLNAHPVAQHVPSHRAGGFRPPSTRTTVDSLSDWDPEKSAPVPDTQAARSSLSAAMISAATADTAAFTFSEPRVLDRFRRRTDASLCEWAAGAPDDAAVPDARDFPGLPLALRDSSAYGPFEFDRAFTQRALARSQGPWQPRRGMRARLCALARACVGVVAFAAGLSVALLNGRR